MNVSDDLSARQFVRFALRIFPSHCYIYLRILYTYMCTYSFEQPFSVFIIVLVLVLWCYCCCCFNWRCSRCRCCFSSLVHFFLFSHSTFFNVPHSNCTAENIVDRLYYLNIFLFSLSLSFSLFLYLCFFLSVCSFLVECFLYGFVLPLVFYTK